LPGENEPLIQIVYRRKPREIVFLRKKPADPKTEYQLRCREAFKRVAGLSKKLTIEEVSALTGYRIYDRDKNLLITPEGEILPKTAALVKHFLTGTGFGRTYKPRKWELALAGYFVSIRELERVAESLSRLARIMQSHAPRARS